MNDRVAVVERERERRGCDGVATTGRSLTA